MDLTYFNPHSQSEADFLASFVARQDILAYLVGQLRLTESERPARHHLIVAPRGYGKTTLLRRLAIAALAEGDLRTRYVALTFREEQHNVISLDVFWRNCLQSLLEAREDENAPSQELEELNAAWNRLSPRQHLKRSEQDGEPAWHEFVTRCEQSQRRPLLLIDNLDTLLEGLESNHQWALRRILQRDNGPVLIAAAPKYPTSTHNPDAAFYEFFRIHTLDKLDNNEVTACLRVLATHRGDKGASVLTLLDTEPGRVASLNAMAGGNPRTLGVLYTVLESHMSADVLSQLSAMLDTFTGWYQARTEEMPIQARAVFDALALNWDPITAARLSEVTGLDVPAVSSQLSRLEKGGYAETVSLSARKKGRNAYQVSERFFNIWYLMRNGPRRARQNIKFLTVFLQSCFSGAERKNLAEKTLDGQGSDPRYLVALAISLRGGRLQEQLLEQAQQLSVRLGQPGEYDRVIDELRMDGRIKQSPGSPERLADPNQALQAADAVIKRLAGSDDLESRRNVAIALVNKGVTLAQLNRSENALAVYDDVVERFAAAPELALREQVAMALVNKGVRLGQLNRSEDALAVYDDVVERFGAAPELALRERVAMALINKGVTLGQLNRSEDELAVYDEVVERFGAAPEVAFLSATDVETRAFLHANFAYALTLQGGDPALVRRHVEEAVSDGTSISAAGRELLATLAFLDKGSGPNWPMVYEHVGRAMESGDTLLWSTYLDDVQRVLWFVLSTGEGESLRRWMEKADYQARYAPLYHALVAALEGPDHLLRINPETRQPAARIFAGIERRQKLHTKEARRRTSATED